MAGGHTAAAMSAYAWASGINRADAESLIYQEDNRVITADPHAYKIAIGVSLSPAADGTDNVSVGRQNLQGAYLAQKTINDAGGVNGHMLYLVVANDSSSSDGAAAAAQKLATQGDILAFAGFAYSSTTKRALPYTAQRGIPVIAPTASSPDLNSAQFYDGAVSYFFRTCPGDAEQGKEGADYLLHTLLKGTARPTIAVFGDPNDAYANRLSGVVRQEAAAGGARVVAYALGRLNGAPTRASLRQALAAIGSGSLSPYQGIAGRIDYLSPGGGANGDPVNKALVVLRLDAEFGRTHLDGRLLGRY